MNVRSSKGFTGHAALALAQPDEGARAMLSSRPDLVDEVAVDGDGHDLDTPAELARWTSRPR